MKRWIALLLLITMFVWLIAGCGAKGTESAENTPAADPSTQEEAAPAAEETDYTGVKIGMLFDNTMIAQGWHKEQADSILFNHKSHLL